MHSLQALHSAALCVLSATLAFSQPPASIQGFGSVAVNIPTKITVSLSFTGLSAIPAFSLTYGVDFAAATPSCVLAATTTCTVQVTFKPLSPGLRQDALRAKGQSGNVLATVFLHGIGLAPQLLLYPGIISTFAGNGSWAYVDNANPAHASFRNPQGLAIDPAGNVLIADSVNQVIRKVSAAGGAVTTIAGNANADYKGDGGLATSASLNSPTAVALDAAGNLYIADQGNNVIREVDAVTGIITTVAGGSTVASQSDQLGDGGPATSAILNGPQSVAIDSSGNIFTADAYHQLVRKVNASTGIITVVAGGGTAVGTDGFGDGGPATSAQLSNQLNVALDSADNLYIADTGDCLVRLVNSSSGVISAVAGNGACGYSGDGNLATSASLNSPNGVYVDPAGNIYIADFGNNVVRQVSAATGRIATLIGNGTNGYLGDGNIPSAASLANPIAVALDSIGSVYVADYVNNVIRKVSFAPVSMSFPNETVGAASPAQTVAAFNIGNETLNFTNLSITANFRQQASGGVDCNLSSTVLPGAGCTVAALFAPTTVGTLSGSLIFSTNSLNGAPSSKSVPLSGTAIAGSGPKASLSAAGLTFASRNEGTVSPAQTVTLSNTGGSAFNIYTIWLSGAQAADFRLTTTCGSTLAASASCGISVAFAPTSGGTRSAALAINDSIAGSPQTVALIGAGVAGTVSSNPVSLSFIQPVNSTSAAQTVVLSNTGTIPVAIGSLWVSGPNSTEFSISSTCAASLAVGASCNASIGFTPGATGSRTAMLSFSDNASGSPQTVALSGNGTAPGILASFNQAALNFSQSIGSTSAPQTVTLTNVGAASLNIFGASLAGPDSADFQLSTACSFALAPGASCNTSITFTPGALGSRTAAFSISDNAVGSPQVVSISGTGTAVPPGVLSLSNAGLSFTQTVGSAGPSQTIIFTNAGPVPVNIAGVALSGANSADFGITTDCGSVLPVGANCTATLSFAPSVAGSLTAAVILSDDAAGAPHAVTLSGTGTAVVSAGLRFIPVIPCRVADTRGVNGPFGGPILPGGKSRDFIIPAGACGIPSTAKAYSLNFTVIPSGILGFLSVWPSGQAQPVVSLLNSDGRVKANAAIVPASASGGVAVYASNNSHVIIDVNGYFVPAADTSALAFYPLTPCRIFDSRSASTGGPSLTGGQAREVDVLSSPCNVSSAAKAYSLNFTAVPKAPLGYLATWPFGQSQPVVSTLNAPTGAVTANAAIVPAGDAGKINVYTSSNADVIIDINGYFGPPAAGALSLFNLMPCRVLDTRGIGAGAPFNGTLPISVSGSSCQVPATAHAYVLNATVVPSRPLGFLSLWPNGAPQAVVSTLNASDAAVTSDAAIVPTTNGSVNAYASNPTQLILDIAAYFAP